MPTGIAITDPREQLFAAAERVLLRDGPNALTNRAVTGEAGVANGVLHRHFPGFDAFLADLVLDRADRIAAQVGTLRQQAGKGTVTGNLTTALMNLFGPATIAIFGLVTSRDRVRARVRQARPGSVPVVLQEAESAITSYLAAEQQAGRITPGADIATIALTLIGAVHHLFASSEGTRLPRPRVRKIVATVTSPIQAPATSPGSRQDGKPRQSRGQQPPSGSS